MFIAGPDDEAEVNYFFMTEEERAELDEYYRKLNEQRSAELLEHERKLAEIPAARVAAVPSRSRATQDVTSESVFVASLDYRTVRFKGKEYGLTRNQAAIVKILHEAHLRGTPGVGTHALSDAIEAETSRVRDSFKNSPLWRTLIIPVRKPRGTYKLNLP